MGRDPMSHSEAYYPRAFSRGPWKSRKNILRKGSSKEGWGKGENFGIE